VNKLQKAIENFIDIQLEKKATLFDIENEIDKVEEAALKKARKKQRIQWRKMDRNKSR